MEEVDVMNIKMVILAAFSIAGASCAPSSNATCQAISKDIKVYIGDNASAYGDLVGMLQKGEFDKILALAPSMGGEVREYRDHTPSYCKFYGKVEKSKEVLYPSRRGNEIGGSLEIYYGVDGNVKVAEFYVTPIAP